MNLGRRSRAATASPGAAAAGAHRSVAQVPAGQASDAHQQWHCPLAGDTRCAQASALPDLDTFVSPQGERGGWGAVQVDRGKAISVSSPRAVPAV